LPHSYRLRLINAGSMAPIVFSVDNHNLTVIEADGVEVEPITFTGGIQVEVGQRYSVVLHADRDHHEQYWMRAALVADGFKVCKSYPWALVSR
jgi:iron transport multicopper oxidase